MISGTLDSAIASVAEAMQDDARPGDRDDLNAR